jgi:hypothetical protein
MKEMIVRGDLQRCLVVCPGSLADQWQDELSKCLLDGGAYTINLFRGLFNPFTVIV